uniref:Uncharacterized protein n=1 Tax=Arundo donax TaxID=35708 RepID=A0A0A9AMT8_ARUDO
MRADAHESEFFISSSTDSMRSPLSEWLSVRDSMQTLLGIGLESLAKEFLRVR